MAPLTYLLILLSALGTASSQLLVKRGSGILKGMLNFEGNFFELVKKIFTIVFEPHIFIALILNFLILFTWLKVLGKAELSFAYPILISLTILLTSISSLIIFRETVTGFKIAGMLFIITGLFLMANGNQ